MDEAREKRLKDFGAVRFELTERHVKLLRAASVDHQDDIEWGGPWVDPKRPFGNGDYLRDIYETLTGDHEWDSDHDLPRGLTPIEWAARQEEYRALYLELARALQIVLSSGSFEAGVYETPKYLDDWERVEA